MYLLCFPQQLFCKPIVMTYTVSVLADVVTLLCYKPISIVVYSMYPRQQCVSTYCYVKDVCLHEHTVSY